MAIVALTHENPQILSQNTVPALFLVIAITEFVCIILDRLIYSAKALRLKWVMQLATVFGYHIWIFFILPSSKECVILF